MGGMELRTARQAQRRRRDENVAADRAAEKARGLFLRADEVAGLRYHLDRVERGVVDDWSLRGVVRRVLDKSGEIELRPAYRRDGAYPADEHPDMLCPRCESESKSVDFGNAYHECRSWGHAFLLVAPDD
jgi:hypothetical protein